jgi:NitT/TauT family transport system substrate-binding protein
LRGALHNAGLSWKTDVEIVELKSPVAVIEAVKGGDAEVGVVWGPLDLQAKKQGLRVVLTSRDLLPGHPCCRIAVTGENFNAKGAEVWKRFLRAVLKAERFARGSEANQQETVDIILKYAPLDRDIIENAYYHGILDQTTDPNLKGVKDIWDILVAAEYLEPGDNNPLAFIETEPYLKALAELQAAEPNDEFWKKTAAAVVPRNQGQAGGGKK